MEPIGVKDNLIGGVRNVQKDHKVILNGDGSLDGPNLKLVESFQVLLTLQTSGYQMEPIGVKDNLIGGVRNVQKDHKGILKGDGILDGPNSKLVERFKELGTPQVSGYQMEPLRVKDNLIGGSRNIQKDHKGILKGDESLDGPNSRLVKRFKVFWTP
jgi:hypothetical protein